MLIKKVLTSRKQHQVKLGYHFTIVSTWALLPSCCHHSEACHNQAFPAVNVQAPAATKLLLVSNTQTLAAIEQMPAATAQAPITLASLPCKPSSNQSPMSQPATCQLPSSLCPPIPAGQSPSTPLGNSQIGKPGKAISPKPNLGGTAAQFGSLPNGEWTDRLSNSENHATNSATEFG
ncbi:hypothetical protein DSO57_1004176 [Entomophthora muscae]|uniref:Uncharacterized protein n=1 Tax=Entomophthora muscae TaxID=34485 RepID=A0ACC2UUT7_9FUNG|nr:hypothetical protein DSO57_1004176 [Entomophthora muscae]